jgi:serine/threonine-protein kinase
MRYRTGRFLRRHRLAANGPRSCGVVAPPRTGRDGVAVRPGQARDRRAPRPVTDFLVRLSKTSADTVVTTEKLTAREVLQQGVKRLDVELADQPAMRASLLAVMGRVHNHMGLDDEAADLLSRRSAPAAQAERRRPRPAPRPARTWRT